MMNQENGLITVAAAGIGNQTNPLKKTGEQDGG